MGFYALAGVVLLAGAVAAIFLPTGQRWLAVAGLGAALVAGIILWLTGGYDDLEGSPWIALALSSFSSEEDGARVSASAI